MVEILNYASDRKYYYTAYELLVDSLGPWSLDCLGPAKKKNLLFNLQDHLFINMLAQTIFWQCHRAQLSWVVGTHLLLISPQSNQPDVIIITRLG